MSNLEIDKHPTPFSRARRRLLGELDWALAFGFGRLQPAPNLLCLRIFAMRRSGHHAVVNWIRYQCPGRHYFLNDCKLGHSPFGSAVFSSSVIRGIIGEHRCFRPGLERSGWFTYKGTLLYNYEEADLSKVPEIMPVDEEKARVGQSRRRHDILILRDPYNLIASKLKWAYGTYDRPSKPTLDQVADAKRLWVMYAREYLGETSYLCDCIRINFNRWFSDREYRDDLGQAIGFDNRDIGKEEVAKWGPTMTSDSFDGLRYEGRAEEMKVLERWKAFEQDPFYRDLMSDPELHELSVAIFGKVPGTERLLRA